MNIFDKPGKSSRSRLFFWHFRELFWEFRQCAEIAEDNESIQFRQCWQCCRQSRQFRQIQILPELSKIFIFWIYMKSSCKPDPVKSRISGSNPSQAEMILARESYCACAKKKRWKSRCENRLFSSTCRFDLRPQIHYPSPSQNHGAKWLNISIGVCLPICPVIFIIIRDIHFSLVFSKPSLHFMAWHGQ